MLYMPSTWYSIGVMSELANRPSTYFLKSPYVIEQFLILQLKSSENLSAYPYFTQVLASSSHRPDGIIPYLFMNASSILAYGDFFLTMNQLGIFLVNARRSWSDSIFESDSVIIHLPSSVSLAFTIS